MASLEHAIRPVARQGGRLLARQTRLSKQHPSHRCLFTSPHIRPRHRHPQPERPSHISQYATASTTNMGSTGFLAPPLNIPKWLEENSHLLKPPINNYCVYSDPLTIMIVGGPNARTDYHINETPEFFYQYKGRMLLKTVQNGEFRDVYINEGELFLLPGNTPHNPVRFAETVGVVIEQPRPEGSMDRLRWYCQSCGEKVHEAAFHCTDLGTQIKDAVNGFKEDLEKRKCGNCGEICDVAPKPEAMERMRTGS